MCDCRKSVFLDVVLFPQCYLVLPRQVRLSSAVILSVRFFVRLTYMWVILGHSNRPFFIQYLYKQYNLFLNTYHCLLWCFCIIISLYLNFRHYEAGHSSSSSSGRCEAYFGPHLRGDSRGSQGKHINVHIYSGTRGRSTLVSAFCHPQISFWL